MASQGGLNVLSFVNEKDNKAVGLSLSSTHVFSGYRHFRFSQSATCDQRRTR